MSVSGALRKFKNQLNQSTLVDRIKGWKDLRGIKKGTTVELYYLDKNQQKSRIVGQFRGKKGPQVKLGKYRKELPEYTTLRYREGNNAIIYESGIEGIIKPTQEKIIKSEFDNRYHPDDESSGNPHRNRWWYFVLFCNNKTVISGSLNLNGTKEIIGETCIQVYHPDKEPIQVSKEYEYHTASKEKFHVGLGRSQFFEKDGKYCLEIQEEGIHLKIKGEPEIPFEDFPLTININNGNAGNMKWGIPILKGEFSGSLSIDGIEEGVEGVIFHDHNLDNVTRGLHTLRHYRGWMWGINYRKDETILFMKAFYNPEDINLIVYQKESEKFQQKTVNSVFLEKDNSVRVLIDGKTYSFRPENTHQLGCPNKSSVFEKMLEKCFEWTHAYSNSDPDNLLYMEIKKARNPKNLVAGNNHINSKLYSKIIEKLPGFNRS